MTLSLNNYNLNGFGTLTSIYIICTAIMTWTENKLITTIWGHGYKCIVWMEVPELCLQLWCNIVCMNEVTRLYGWSVYTDQFQYKSLVPPSMDHLLKFYLLLSPFCSYATFVRHHLLANAHFIHYSLIGLQLSSQSCHVVSTPFYILFLFSKN